MPADASAYVASAAAAPAGGAGINDLMSALQSGRRPSGPALVPGGAPAAAAPQVAASASDGAAQTAPPVSRIDAVRASVPAPGVESTVLSGRGLVTPDQRVRGAIAERRAQASRETGGAPVSSKDLENLF